MDLLGNPGQGEEALWQSRKQAVLEQDPPLGGPRQAADHRQQRGLARAARSLEHRDAVRLERQADAADRPELVGAALVEGLADVAQLDHVSASPCRGR